MVTDATLAIADRHVDEARDRIARQRALIERLQTRGCPVAAAEAILELFEKIHCGMVEHRDRIGHKRLDVTLIRRRVP